MAFLTTGDDKKKLNINLFKNNNLVITAKFLDYFWIEIQTDSSFLYYFLGADFLRKIIERREWKYYCEKVLSCHMFVFVLARKGAVLPYIKKSYIHSM